MGADWGNRFFEALEEQKAGNEADSSEFTGYAFEVGQRVKRCKDVYSPELGMKTGSVVRRYSKPQYEIGGTVLGPYPELYAVDWDDNTHGRAYLPHGLQEA